MNESLKEFQSLPHVERCKKENNLKMKQTSNISKKTCNKKLNVKQKGQNRIAKKSCIKFAKKYTTPKTVLREAIKTYDSHIQSTMNVLKQPLNGTTLTPDELKTLFLKYKLDGHYRASANSSAFGTILNKYDSINNSAPCDATNQHRYVNEISENNWQSNFNTENERQGENINLQRGLSYDSWKDNREVLGPININDTGESRPSYYEQNSLVDNNCKHMFAGYDTQTYCDSSVSSNTQNLEQASKLNSIITDEGYPYNLCNTTLNYSSIHENGFHINKWGNNSMSMSENNNLPYNSGNLSIHPWNGTASTKLETCHDSQYDVHNSTIYDTNVSLDKDFSDDRSSFNKYIDTTMYSPTVDDDKCKYTSNSHDVNVQQDCNNLAYDNNRYTFNSPPIMSETSNFRIEANAIATFSANMAGQYPQCNI